jgi:hypothetical protein
MPPPLDLLSWDFWVGALGFWAKDSESLYRLALIVAGLIGIPLLYSRTRSANRSLGLGPRTRRPPKAVGLRQEQLESASDDDHTQLPEGLTPAAHWSAAPPDAPDNPE